MNFKSMNHIAIGLVVAVAAAGIFSSCGKKAEASNRNMVVVFVTGDAHVVKPTGEVAATIGMVVNETDQIKTTTGSVDLQTRAGSAIRIREFTTVTVAGLEGPSGGNTKIQMNHGSLMANVNKASASDNFSVVTPTAVAGVRGTRFSVDVQDGQSPKVKVVDGKVALAPRIAALDNLSQEQIDSNPELKKLSELSATTEVVLADKTEATLNPELEKKVIAVNEVLEEAIAASAPKESEKAEPSAKAEKEAPKAAPAIVFNETQLKQIEKKSSDLNKVVESEKGNLVSTKEAVFTAQEQVDQETLVAVDPKIMEKVAGKEKVDTAALESIKNDRAKREEIVLKKIEEAAAGEDLKSDEAIKNHYDKLEMIILKNGEKISGAVIAQTGDVMVIHSSKGVRRVNKAEIEAQEFL